MKTEEIQKRMTEVMLQSAKHVVELIQRKDGSCGHEGCKLTPENGEDWVPIYRAMHRLMAFSLHSTSELVFSLIGTIAKLLDQLSKERGSEVKLSKNRTDEMLGSLVTLTAAQQVVYGHLNSMVSVGQDTNADIQYDRILSFLEDEFKQALARIEGGEPAHPTNSHDKMEAMFDEILKDFNPKGQAN